MNNTNYNYSNKEKPKTISINTKYKELYYNAQPEELKESPETLQHRHVFWNYMMHISMQNTIAQMAKMA